MINVKTNDIRRFSDKQTQFLEDMSSKDTIQYLNIVKHALYMESNNKNCKDRAKYNKAHEKMIELLSILIGEE